MENGFNRAHAAKKKNYQQPQTEIISVIMVNTLCASGSGPKTISFGSGKADGEAL